MGRVLVDRRRTGRHRNRAGKPCWHRNGSQPRPPPCTAAPSTSGPDRCCGRRSPALACSSAMRSAPRWRSTIGNARIRGRCRCTGPSSPRCAPAENHRLRRRSYLCRPARPATLTTLSIAAVNVELADTLGQPDLASGALELFAEASAHGVRFLPGWCALVPRLAGIACFAAGRFEDAERWLRVAVTDAQAQRARPVGWHAQEHWILLASGSPPLCRSTPTSCSRLRSIASNISGTSPSPSTRVGSRAGPPAHEAVDAATTRVIMVTDLVGSTPLARRVGDRRFVELLREHNRIVRTRLRQYDGVEFKHTGDGTAAWFLTAGAAVESAVRIHERSSNNRTSLVRTTPSKCGSASRPARL